MLWRVLLVLLAALCLTPGAEAVKARRPQVYASSHYVTQGNGGPFTFVASASGGSDPSGTTVSTSSTLAVQNGDLLITLVSFEDGNGAETVSVTDNGNLNPHTITAGDAAYETTNLTSVYPFYRLSGVTNPTATFTASINAARAFKRIIVMQYRPPTGAVVSKDITGTRKATGTGNGTISNITTGQFSTTGTHVVVCAMEAIYTGGTHSISQINQVAAEDTKQQNGAYQWCGRQTSPLVNAVATTQYSASRQWAATAIAFQAVGGTFVDTDPPLAPTGLAGTIGDAQVSLTWSHANIADVNHFSLQYDCGGGYLTWSPAPTTVAATITGLANETPCNIKVAAVDTAGNTSSYTTPVSFTPTATPIRSAGSPSGSLASGTMSTTISLTTSKNATCKYSTTAGTAYGSMTNTFAGAGTTSHSATASGLSDGNTYHYYVRCDDGASHTNLDDYDISFAVLAVQVVNCTDGVDCYCDLASGHGPLGTSDPLYDPLLLDCMDFEEAALYTGATSPWYSDTGATGNRGFGSWWNQHWTGGNANLGFRNTDPSPYLGPACAFGQCTGMKEYCSAAQGALTAAGVADCWGPGVNSGSCIDIQRSLDFKAENTGLTLTGGKGVTADVGAGNAHFADRWPAGSTCGIQGSRVFTQTTTVGVTRAIASASNWASSGIASTYLKSDEWGNASSNQNIEFWALGNSQAIGTLENYPYRNIVSFGAVGAPGTTAYAACVAGMANAVAHFGSFQCSPPDSPWMVFTADSTLYRRTRDFPDGSWGCTRAYMTGMGTTNVTIKIWHGSTLVVWIDGIDGTQMTNQNYTTMNFDSYANTNAQGTPTSTTAWRYQDNIHIRAGVPVDCSAIGY